MNILVCGGAGYIGSNMVNLLIQKNHKVLVYDNLSKGHRSAVPPAAEFIKADLADAQTLDKTIKQHKTEAVMHFAAFIEVAESVRNPLMYYQNNFCNARNLLDVMLKNNVRKFVFSSTAAVYGMPKNVPIKETEHKKPINPYGHSKLAVEEMCSFLSQNNLLNYAALRYFNACGAGRNSELGEDHCPESHLIPLVIAAAMQKRDDIKIFGTDYPTPDGTCIRDYIHIEDLCSAHLLALEKLDSDKQITLNLGNQKGYSVRQVIDTVKKVSKMDFKVTEAPPRPGDPPILTADASTASSKLNWKPKHTQLEEIIETAWKWHKQNPHGYNDKQ